MLEPCWCHHCGCWSFRTEWGDGIAPGDTCPLCGDMHPGGGVAWESLWEQGGPDRREATDWAHEHREWYG